MERYCGILSASFGDIPLPLPVWVRVSRRAEALPTGGDGDTYQTDVRLARPLPVATVRLRGTAAAESRTLGEYGTLTFTVAPAASDQAGRTISLAGAVLSGIDLHYSQAGMAEAELRFVVEAPQGAVDPFQAEDAS